MPLLVLCSRLPYVSPVNPLVLHAGPDCQPCVSSFATLSRLLALQAPLVQALNEEPEDHMKSATAWSIGQVGRHTSDHAKAVADTGVLPLLVTLENDAHSSEDLKTKCRKALKAVVAKLTNLPALDMLVHRWGHTCMRGPLHCLWGCPCSTFTAHGTKP